ncbi:FAD-dependent oxidoreductase [Blastopirellula marina]|uniref:Xanthan lyase n=1 Tax=Blastopirellula marina TaxID=124 RepID=A0A2S8G1U2_9BACT|nr:FAD-dependent oxidoreductase [Blastopirellula marina]PQO38393.1 xanthan lyase [Blastopirellula marina]PTL45050.1 FAD-dependent oxidoreductase [Blastopirellula marina]
MKRFAASPFRVSLALALLVATVLGYPTWTLAQETKTYDLVVYGGTSAGVIAAVQAKQMGKSVVLISPDQHLGGLSSSGLGLTDSGRQNAIGGLSQEFYHRVYQHYAKDASWKFQTSQQYLAQAEARRASNASNETWWIFEPHVAENVFESFIQEFTIPVERGEYLDREKGVQLDGKRIVSLTTLSGKTFAGKMFIDATYEGDLLAASGVSYTIGRESNAQYGEVGNGVEVAKNTKNHRFRVAVDPYIKPGDPSSGLVWGVHNEGPGEEGSADKRIQAYCYRMCMSRIPENSVPFPKPEGYDEAMFELLFRNYEAGDLRVPLHPGPAPNGKTDTNNNGAFSTDNIGMNYDYPEASYTQREKILQQHTLYQQGLMWTLANHPRVPQAVRDEMAKWGLAKDEFVDNNHWPYQIYVREARRMVSDYVQTESDCRRLRFCEDSVGLGSYNMDSHNTQRFVTEEGTVQNEGDVQVATGGSYAISYRSIVPKKGEAENLLVPVCLSSSHIAYGSIRMEPVFMILGQSAATAASLAIDQKIALQELSYDDLKTQLVKDGQQLAPSGKPLPYSD